MIVKMKSYFLKSNVNPEKLKYYGFEQYGDNYSKELNDLGCDIRYFNNTRRIIYVSHPWKEGRHRKVKRYINDLIKDGLVELKTNYEWWAIIGKWQNYSQKKQDHILAKLDRLNGEQR